MTVPRPREVATFATIPNEARDRNSNSQKIETWYSGGESYGAGKDSSEFTEGTGRSNVGFGWSRHGEHSLAPRPKAKNNKHMDTLKKLIGKTAIGTVVATFGVALVLHAQSEGSGSNTCSDSGGNASCQASSSLPQPCCIYGTDANGTSVSVHTCCKGSSGFLGLFSSQCGVSYTNGTASWGGGGINGSLVVKESGCI